MRVKKRILLRHCLIDRGAVAGKFSASLRERTGATGWSHPLPVRARPYPTAGLCFRSR